MDASDRIGADYSLSTVGILAVLCSVIGLQLGGMTTELLDAQVSVAVALALGTVATAGSGVLGLWFGATRVANSDDE